MPSTTAVMKWLDKDEGGRLVEQYARAMAMRADVVFDELIEIADTPVEGEKVKIDKDGNEEVQRGDMIEHRRLQVDARKWALARMAPKKYGDKVAVDSNVKADIDMNVGVSPSDELQRYIDGIAERRGKTS
jgi:hypothetical protein